MTDSYMRTATVTEWIRRGLERKLGLHLVDDDELRATVQQRVGNPHFMWLRANRVKLGYLRYEMYGRNAAYDAVGSSIERLKEYQRTGNRELLVDVANLVEVEWDNGQPGTYFESNDDGEHVAECLP